VRLDRRHDDDVRDRAHDHDHDYRVRVSDRDPNVGGDARDSLLPQSFVSMGTVLANLRKSIVGAIPPPMR
jgi:hypothetical protein